jgi:hypothetical protein
LLIFSEERGKILHEFAAVMLEEGDGGVAYMRQASRRRAVPQVKDTPCGQPQPQSTAYWEVSHTGDTH